jgi:hypothetical protein
MLKFLRKYNKILLVCFGVFIMISFLVPQALQQLGQGGPQTTAMTIDGQRISFGDTQVAAKQVDAISRLSFGLLPSGAGIDPRGDHWLLLRSEAERAGFVGGPTFGRALLNELGPALVGARLQQQFGPQWQQLMAQNPQFQQAFTQEVDRIKPQIEASHAQLDGSITQRRGDVDEAMAALRGMQLMRTTYRTSPRLSEPRLVQRARELLDQTELEVLFVDVKNKLADDLPAREQAALEEQFNAFRTAPVGSGDFGFSYVQPPRFKLEYLKINRVAIDAIVRVDPVEVQKRLLAGVAPKPEEMAAKRREIEEALRREQTEKLIGEAATAVKSALLTSLLRVPNSSASAFREVPSDWSPPDLAKIAELIPERVRERTGVLIPAPEVVRKTDAWIPASELQNLGELLFTSIRRGSNEIRFNQLLGMVKELLPADSATPPVIVQAGVPMTEPLQDGVGSKFFVTITEALPESPAKSMNDVLEQVVRDRKRLDAFNTLQGQIDTYRAVAAESGMEALASRLRVELGIPVEVRRVRVSGAVGVENGIPALNNAAFTDAVRAKSALIDPKQPLENVPAADRAVAVALPKDLGIVVGKITGYIPLTQEQFRQRASGLLAALSTEALGPNADDPFTIERLERRLNVVHRGRAAEPGPAAPASGTAESTPAAGK